MTFLSAQCRLKLRFVLLTGKTVSKKFKCSLAVKECKDSLAFVQNFLDSKDLNGSS